MAKINAAVEAGIKKILLPEENYQKSYAHHYPVQFVPVRHLEQVFREVIIKDRKAAVGSP